MFKKDNAGPMGLFKPKKVILVEDDGVTTLLFLDHKQYVINTLISLPVTVLTAAAAYVTKNPLLCFCAGINIGIFAMMISTLIWSRNTQKRMKEME
jgi:hypothetical protein